MRGEGDIEALAGLPQSISSKMRVDKRSKECHCVTDYFSGGHEVLL
jgi:hypothetical protein